ncbi:MAG: S-layer homology domain-containing protein [Fervidobacterium sp.]
MKKLLVLLNLTLLVFTSFAAFRDIPKGHWAESYVDRLAEVGIITGFPDGTYRGDEAVTRYQSALLISRTLDYVELLLKEEKEVLGKIQSLVDYNSKSLEELQVELENVKVQLELHDQDIVKLYELVTTLQDKFVYTDEEGNTSEIDLAQLKNDVASLSDILNALAAQLGDIDYLLRKQIAEVEKKTSAKDDELAKNDEELRNTLEELRATVELLQAKYEDLNEAMANMYDTLSQAIITLQEDITNLEAVLTGRLDELEVRVLNIESNLETALPALRDLVYGLSEKIEQLEASMKAYVDVLYDELNGKLEEHEASNNGNFEDIYAAIDNLNNMFSEVLLGQQEEITQIKGQLDNLNEFVVNFSNETSEKLEVLDMRVSLLEDQVASLAQVVDEVKANKNDVEELRQEFKQADNATKNEIQQAKNIATWGVITGVSGLLIGIIALGKAFGWF